MERKRSCEIVSLLKMLGKNSSSEKVSTIESKVFSKGSHPNSHHNIQVSRYPNSYPGKVGNAEYYLFERLDFSKKQLFGKS